MGSNSPYDCEDAAGNLAVNGHNLDGDNSCGGAQKTPEETALGALSANGGPTVGSNGGTAMLTRKPGSSSPALNAAANDVCPPTDQRGVARPQGANCDIGAMERRK